MVLHSLLEYTQELNKACAALSEREAHDLDQEWHELIWNLGEKTLPSSRRAYKIGVVKQNAEAGSDSATWVSRGLMLLKNRRIVC